MKMKELGPGRVGGVRLLDPPLNFFHFQAAFGKHFDK